MPINLVIALPAEAKPLRRHFGLQREQHHTLFPIHTAGDIRLIISGPGKCRAAAACGYLSGALPAENTQWLNIGIAGHGNAAIGRIFPIDEVIDPASDQRWRLNLPSDRPTAILCTVDKTAGHYPDDMLIDMEAAGILHALSAAKTPTDATHIIKIVSDNRQHPARHIDAKHCEHLMEQAIGEIQKHMESPS